MLAQEQVWQESVVLEQWQSFHGGSSNGRVLRSLRFSFLTVHVILPTSGRLVVMGY